MRFRHPDSTLVHLSYCTNVHQAEDLDGILAQLTTYAVPVRERLGAGVLGLGLWLPREAAAALAADPFLVDRLRKELAARGLETVSLNGFPYKGFHEPVVKRQVYLPDWSQPARLSYTLDLARILHRLLPDDAARGSISTLPLGWGGWWSDARSETARRLLDALGLGLTALEREFGRPVRVGLEAEPGCVAETTEELVSALRNTVDPRVLGVCLDACHLAVAFEDPARSVALAAEAGLPVVKLQASAALEAADPSDPATAAALAAFAEPRFLHQTRERSPHGAPLACDDLDEALGRDGHAGLPGRHPWRVHFHVPLHAEPAPPLRSTRPVLEATLGALFGDGRAVTDHVEVETYTWNVLPEEHRPGNGGLADGIACELDWTRQRLLALGLKETD